MITAHKCIFAQPALNTMGREKCQQRGVPQRGGWDFFAS